MLLMRGVSTFNCTLENGYVFESSGVAWQPETSSKRNWNLSCSTLIVFEFCDVNALLRCAASVYDIFHVDFVGIYPAANL